MSQREIKFRAWDGKKMFDNLTFHDKKLRDLDGIGQPIMQFTGLKDKNGKEIYEGDILEIITKNDNDHGFNFDIGTRILVKWMDGGFRLIRPQHYDFEENGFCEICASVGYLFSENHEIDIGYYSKVIGNIYEKQDIKTDIKKIK